MKTIFLSILALATMALSSCSKTKDPVEPGPTAPLRPGYVSGKVIDAQGKPIAKANIMANNTQFYNSNLLGQTDANGNYQLQLSPGSWYVRGSVNIKYENQNYVLDLFTEDDGAFAGTEGAVKNLKLRISGERTGNFGDDGFYGGQIEVFGYLNFFDTDNVELTLEPVGPLVDGNTGQKLTRKVSGMYIEDVPLGKYNVKARYVPENKPLKVRVRNVGTFQNTVMALFEPSYPGATGRYKLNIEVSE
ncbi:carboxypeptidase-like regulatory domain-containing protein [Larkinella arboricola]